MLLMIKFKNIKNLYGFNHINKKAITMTKKTMIEHLENTEVESFLNTLKSNEPLKKVLFKAKNISKQLMVDVVPQMAKATNNLMIEINSGKNTSLKDWNTLKFLRQHLYNLSSYDRSKNENKAFEMACTRSIKLAIMMYDNKDEFEISKDNEVFIMSKVATPMIDVKLKGQKGGTKKQKNTSDELVEVNTGTIDKVWAIKYPSLITSRTSQTKDTKINFTQMTTNFMRELEKVYNVANKKDFNKLLEMVDEKTIENLGNIKAMLDGNEIRQGYIQATENLSVDGEVKKKSA
tara:strand:+ start:465 stop:1337 length:873 start_codon:yes stop_codon:yes gene_type:complete